MKLERDVTEKGEYLYVIHYNTINVTECLMISFQKIFLILDMWRGIDYFKKNSRLLSFHSLNNENFYVLENTCKVSILVRVDFKENDTFNKRFHNECGMAAQACIYNNIDKALDSRKSFRRTINHFPLSLFVSFSLWQTELYLFRYKKSMLLFYIGKANNMRFLFSIFQK